MLTEKNYKDRITLLILIIFIFFISYFINLVDNTETGMLIMKKHLENEDFRVEQLGKIVTSKKVLGIFYFLLYFLACDLFCYLLLEFE